MRKSLLSLLVLFVYSLVAFAQKGTEITWSGQSDWSGVTEKDTLISYASGDWSIQASKKTGSSSPTVNATSLDFRSYANNVVVISNTAGNIGKLVFHISAAGKKRWADITPSEGTITHDTDNGVIIWEAGDAEAQSLTLTVGEKATYGTEGATKAGQFDFSSVTAYTKAELTVTEPEPVPGFVLYHAGYNGNPGYIAFNGTEVGAQGILVPLPNVPSYDKARFAWQLVETETEGEYKIKNVGTGLFLGVAGYNQTPTAVAEADASVYTKAAYGDYTTFNCPKGSYGPTYSWLHVASNYKLTGWTQSEAASWFTEQETSAIDEVLNLMAKADELDAAIAAAQDMKRNITGYTEYTDYITSADQFNSNAKEMTPGEGTYEALLDGDPTTFFHSQWSTGWEAKMPHDLQVKLPGNELTELVVRYAARNNKGNYLNIPTAMKIYGGTVDSVGNVTWEETAFDTLTAEAGAYNNFDVEGIGGRSGRFTINTGEAVYTAFKFEVTDTYYAGRNEKFFTYGEFQISSAREVAPSVEASETQVLALDYAVAQAEAAQLGVSDYDALIAGINTAMENIENGVEPEPIPEVQAALTAALADAQEAIALRGPGYPVAEGTSYNALSEAIATAQALTYPLPADVDALTAAVRTYKCARDVEMPALNHKYAFAITYQGETKYYLQNAHTQNVLRPYVAEEELGDTLIFKCVAEEEGKFTFTNSDGKYLTLTQPAKSDYSTVCTGVADEKGETTDVTFEKIYRSNANAVAPADETELFGLLSWYGIRGYNTSNVPQYGYLVVKHSEDRFDGTSAPYYNANFTSAIKLIDLGIDPTLLTSVTPVTTDTLEALPEQVVFTFEKDVQEVTSVRLRHNGWGGLRGTELVGEEGLVTTNADTVTVNVPAYLVQGATQMSLTVMGTGIDGGALSDGENGEMVVVHYQYTPDPARFVFVEANPADSSTVEKLDSIIVTFEHPDGGLTGFAKDVVLNVLDAESNVVTTATIGLDMVTNDSWNTNALITLAEPVTTNGTYTITVPEATVFDNNYNADDEDYGVANWGAIYNPEFTLTYTVEAPKNTFAYTSVDPENGAEVSSLSLIQLTFPTVSGSVSGGYLPVVDTTSNDTVDWVSLNWADYNGGSTVVNMTLSEGLTTAGTYSITVPEGFIYDDKFIFVTDENGEYVTDEEGNWVYDASQATFNPEFTLTYTIVESVAEEYPINFPRDQVRTRTDRSLSSVSLTAEDQAEQTLNVDYMHPYNDLTEDANSRLTVPAGATLTTTFNYSGEWMHGYVYIDLENDKQFSFIDGNTNQTGTDLQTFSFYSGSFTNDAAGYNSLGAYITGNARSVINPPTFQAPSTPGEYRIRFKVDWNSVDAGGQKAADGTCTGHNGILSNGGYIVDAILEVTSNSTGIDAATLDKDAKVYTLDGRRVFVNGKLNRGFYIINGQKTYVK